MSEKQDCNLGLSIRKIDRVFYLLDQTETNLGELFQTIRQLNELIKQVGIPIEKAQTLQMRELLEFLSKSNDQFVAGIANRILEAFNTIEGVFKLENGTKVDLKKIQEPLNKVFIPPALLQKFAEMNLQFIGELAFYSENELIEKGIGSQFLGQIKMKLSLIGLSLSLNEKDIQKIKNVLAKSKTKQ